MARVDPFKRIHTEDYDKEYINLIERLGFSFNEPMRQLTDAMQGNIGFENLRREIVTYDVSVDSNRVPQKNALIRSKYRAPRGIIVINYENRDAAKTYVTSGIFVSFTANNNLISIKEITGLAANTNYRLTLEIIE